MTAPNTWLFVLRNSRRPYLDNYGAPNRTIFEYSISDFDYSISDFDHSIPDFDHSISVSDNSIVDFDYSISAVDYSIVDFDLPISVLHIHMHGMLWYIL